MNSLSLLIFYLSFFLTCAFTVKTGMNVEDNAESSGDPNDDNNSESMLISPGENSAESEGHASSSPTHRVAESLCSSRRQGSKVHAIKDATTDEFPFMAALLNQRNEYICSGSVVSNSMILTSAKCAKSPVYFAVLNALTSSKNNRSAALRIENVDSFPTEAGSSNIRDIGVIRIEDHNHTITSKVKISDITDFKDVTDMEALGYGLNTDIGELKHLQYIGLEHKDSHDRDNELKKGFIDCIDTNVTTCFKDFGGPVIFDDMLIGIVVSGQNRCLAEITSKYAANYQATEIVPVYVFHDWLEDLIKKNEKSRRTIALRTYPENPLLDARRYEHSSVTNSFASEIAIPSTLITLVVGLCLKLL